MPKKNLSINPHSLMKQEAKESSTKIAEQLTKNKPIIENLSKQLKDYNPHSVMIVGRGSSDHAGVFAKYLIEIEAGIPTFAAAPSVTTIYNRRLNLQGCLVIIISQSGRSPDILEEARQCRVSGAFCVALLNEEKAPLAELVDCVIPLRAGEEKSVAATKSFLATLTALLQLVAYWQDNTELQLALNSIPRALQSIVDSPIQLTVQDLDKTQNLIVLGRGLGFSICKEIALKLKEVCSIHAEAFSSAEFLHGPVTLAEHELKVLVIEVDDESSSAHHELIENIKSRGANLVYLNQNKQQIHPRIAPLIVLQRFYLDIEKIAVSRGLNPDQPDGLRKVTETL